MRTHVPALIALLAPATGSLVWTQVGNAGMACNGAEYLGELTGGQGASSAGECLKLVQDSDQNPDYGLWRGEVGGTRGCYACNLRGRGLGPDPTVWPFDEHVVGEVSLCGVDKSAPTPPPSAVWTGTTETFTWAANTKCTEGRGQNPVTFTNSIARMADGLSSCVEQTGAASGLKYYAKWTCSQNARGGKLTSVKCSQDATCTTCAGETAVYEVNTLDDSRGACLDMTSASSIDDDDQYFAYLMTPAKDATSGVLDPTYEAAVPPCMLDTTPPPTPPPPTPPPATTCAECVAQDNKQWCWPDDNGFSKALGMKDAGHCATPGGLDCSYARSTCNMPVDCACNDCENSGACGGPGPTPAPASTCDACIAQDNKQWCWQADGTGKCATPGGWDCSYDRSTCKMSIDCACSDCADSDKCKNAPTPAPYPDDCQTCVAQGDEWCHDGTESPGGVCGPKLGTRCSYVRAVCNTPNDCQCQSCANTACQPSAPTPPPPPSPPTPPPSPTPLTPCETCMAEQKEWCWKTNTCIEAGGTCPHDSCVYGDASKDLCACTSCVDMQCQGTAPTPPPATTCEECVAQDNKQWCWPDDNGFSEALGVKDAGHCATPGGTDCSYARSTCKMPVDCACSDCADSSQCGGPNPPDTWTGTAKVYEYTHGTSCDSKERSAEPAWTVATISTMPNDFYSKCSAEKKTSGYGFLYYKETCQHSGTRYGSNSLTRTICSDPQCTSCDASKMVTYQIEWPTDKGQACMTATGFSHVDMKSYMMEPLSSVVTKSGDITAVSPPCFTEPPKPPTPAPTPTEWATCEGCIAGGIEANRQWCWGEPLAEGGFGKAHCATPGGIDCSVARSTCPKGMGKDHDDCKCHACDDSEECGGPKKGSSKSKAGIGVGLGLGIPLAAGGLFMFQKKRNQQRALSMGTAQQALTASGTNTGGLEPADYAQL